MTTSSMLEDDMFNWSKASLTPRNRLNSGTNTTTAQEKSQADAQTNK